MIKNNFRILKKQYAYLQTILKVPVKFQKDWPKTVGELRAEGTYILYISVVLGFEKSLSQKCKNCDKK